MSLNRELILHQVDVFVVIRGGHILPGGLGLVTRLSDVQVIT